jgi:hypothetical protein
MLPVVDNFMVDVLTLSVKPVNVGFHPPEAILHVPDPIVRVLVEVEVFVNELTVTL